MDPVIWLWWSNKEKADKESGRDKDFCRYVLLHETTYDSNELAGVMRHGTWTKKILQARQKS